MKKASRKTPQSVELVAAATATLQLLRAIAMDAGDLDDAYGELIATVENRLCNAIEATP